jgi:ribosomal protein L11 methylase PrmA
MRYSPHGTEGSAAAQLIGCYEHELHETVEKLIAQGFGTILNIGCASGYYAAGLARRLPQASVHAFDINEQAQANCRETAKLNGVEDRVIVGGRFELADFARFADRRPLAIVDIEGAELELLDPAAAPALAAMTLLVECHDCFKPGISKTLAARFAATHQVTRFDHTTQAAKLPDWLMAADHLDQLIAIWEWRVGPTPWLLLEAK